MIKNKEIKKFLNFFKIATVIFLINFFLPSLVRAETPNIRNLTTNSSQIGRFQKFEITFQISKTYPNDGSTNSFLPYYYYDPNDTPSADPGRKSPYGVEGITINANFISPSGKNIVVPAFYYQEYLRSGSSSGETIEPTNNFSWKVRFAPEEIGTYQYYLTVEDKDSHISGGKINRYPESGYLTFTATASNSKGFIRVSSKDPRFLAFSSGESFIPIGSGKQWWRGTGRSYYYEAAFDIWRQNGINFTRIWDQNDGYGLTVEGHYDAYKWPDDFNPVDNKIDINSLPKGTQINQRGAYDLDKIIESAEKNGVYIQLCSHGDAYWIWDGSIYEPPDGAGASFNSLRHLNYWKRNFRYRVARWGHSPAILAWELWNEHGHLLSGSEAFKFYQTYGEYQNQTDPYHHLRTTSQGSQAYSPGFWSSPAMDIANYHDYMMISRYAASLTNDEVNFVSKFAWCLGTKGSYCSGLGLGDGSSWSGDFKPWVWGELDVGTSNWNEPNPKTKSGGARVRMLHNTTWAGLFSPMGVSPLDWYWDQEDSSTTQSRYTDRKATAAFFAGIDYDGGKFTFLMSDNMRPSGYSGETIPTSNSQIRVFGMRRADKKAAYFWLVHQDNTWNNYPNSPAISTNITANNLLSERYKVQIWNTHNGQIVSQTEASGPTINVSVSGLTEDAAVKIEPTNMPSPSSTPSVFTKGDVNHSDGNDSVNLEDILLILKNYTKIASGVSGYFDSEATNDNKINSFDFGWIIKNWNL